MVSLVKKKNGNLDSPAFEIMFKWPWHWLWLLSYALFSKKHNFQRSTQLNRDPQGSRSDCNLPEQKINQVWVKDKGCCQSEGG